MACDHIAAFFKTHRDFSLGIRASCNGVYSKTEQMAFSLYELGYCLIGRIYRTGPQAHSINLLAVYFHYYGCSRSDAASTGNMEVNKTITIRNPEHLFCHKGLNILRINLLLLVCKGLEPCKYPIDLFIAELVAYFLKLCLKGMSPGVFPKDQGPFAETYVLGIDNLIGRTFL